MTFELLLRPGRDDQISHLWGQEVPQPAYTFDFTHLVGDALFELLVQFLYLFCSLAQFFQKSRVLDSDNRLIREGFTRQDACGRITRSSASEEARYSPSRDHPTTARIHLNGAATHPLIETQVRSISSSRFCAVQQRYARSRTNSGSGGRMLEKMRKSTAKRLGSHRD
jgi:hypothetical protein